MSSLCLDNTSIAFVTITAPYHDFKHNSGGARREIDSICSFLADPMEYASSSKPYSDFYCTQGPLTVS